MTDNVVKLTFNNDLRNDRPTVLELVAAGSFPGRNLRDTRDSGLKMRQVEHFRALVDRIAADSNYTLDRDSTVRAAAMLIASKNDYRSATATARKDGVFLIPNEEEVVKGLSMLNYAKGVLGDERITSSEARVNVSGMLDSVAVAAPAAAPVQQVAEAKTSVQQAEAAPQSAADMVQVSLNSTDGTKFRRPTVLQLVTGAGYRSRNLRTGDVVEVDVPEVKAFRDLTNHIAANYAMSFSNAERAAAALIATKNGYDSANSVMRRDGVFAVPNDAEVVAGLNGLGRGGAQAARAR